MFPGPKSRACLEELGHYVITDPWPFVIDLERCRGLALATIDGQVLQDWGGLYGSKLLGYNHPALLTPAFQARLARAATTKMANPDFLTEDCLAYYRLLHCLRPACWAAEPRVEVYAVNSGAEAVENLCKYLLNLHDRKRGLTPGTPVPRRFIRFDGAFHGRTVFALNLTGLAHAPVITRDFQGLFSHAHVVPFPSLDPEDPAATAAAVEASLAAIRQLLEAHPGEVVGILGEPLQGAGGQRVAGPGFWSRLADLAHAHDTYLAFDEVQTAGGPCGAIFAADLLGLGHAPQGIAVAKKFGNGAVYMRHPMQDEGVLDSTWGGHLADMVRVVEEFAVVEREDLLAQVPAKTAHLVDGLTALARRHPTVLGKVRGLGLYQGFSLRDPATTAAFVERARDQEGLFLLTAGPGVIRLRPPLDVTAQDIEGLLAGLDRICR